MEKIYKPKFHPTPDKGWINDPNGFCLYKGKLRLFAQHYPHSTSWGPMHWLAFSFDDNLTYKDEGIALSPERDYELPWGCFSGSALEIGGTLHLYYTGAMEGKQVVCLAQSNDGLVFAKHPDNPIIDGDKLPEGYSIKDFRDPFAFFRHGLVYLLVGCKKKERGCSLLLFSSLDGKAFSFVSVFADFYGFGSGMAECPGIVFPDASSDEAILFYSPQSHKKVPYHFQNKNHSVCQFGRVDFDKGVFVPEKEEEELDCGFDVYAAQPLNLGDGRLYLASWEAMWERDYPMAKDGYANSLQIREIALDNGVLRQFPPKPILDAFKKETRFAPFALAGESKSFEVAQSDNSACRVIAIKLKGKGNFQVEVDGYALSYSASSSELTFDRSRSAYLEEKDGLRRTVYLGGQGLSDLLLLIDGYCYDFYLNGGLLSFSSQYYPTHRSLCFQGEVEVGSISLKSLG